MTLKITTACINCGYCATECPNQAIYQAGMDWAFAEGTDMRGQQKLFSGTDVDAWDLQPAMSDTFYYIVPEKCNMCHDLEEPQCLVVCPDPSCLILYP